MPAWHAATATVVGPKHRRDGRGGQDASASQTIPGGHAIAIADGHGSDRCFRSDRGADLAVRAALALLDDVTATSSFREGVEAIPSALVESWRRLVTEDFGAHPFGTLPADADTEADAEDDSPFTAYGTTLLAAAARGDELLLVHLGDGESLVAEAGGKPRRSFARDPLLAADMTTSLALEDAVRHVHVAAFDRASDPIDLVVLASDGYTNAFTDDAAFEQVGSDLLKWLDVRGPDWIADELPAWLEHSAGVTGDDASVGVLYRWPLPQLP